METKHFIVNGNVVQQHLQFETDPATGDEVLVSVSNPVAPYIVGMRKYETSEVKLPADVQEVTEGEANKLRSQQEAFAREQLNKFLAGMQAEAEKAIAVRRDKLREALNAGDVDGATALLMP